VHGVGEVLRVGALDGDVAGGVRHPVLRVVEPVPLVRCVLGLAGQLCLEEVQWERQAQVRPDQVLRVLVAELRGDQLAPVATLRAEPVVAQLVAHEPHPQVGGAVEVDPGAPQRGREDEPGQRRDHHVEGVGGVAAERRRVRERADHLLEVPERPRPAVGEHQRHRGRTAAALVHEVDRHVVEHGAEVRVGVHPRFLGPPVVPVAPVRDELLQVGAVGAVSPVGVTDVVGPADVREPTLQIVEDLVGNGDGEGLGRHGYFASAPPSTGRVVPVT
jgi:hypothetical protein